MPEGLFVITVASEKGGVGKTTLATNLAVYLKALREDLPVTIASFDNHFSVDNMFAIGGGRAPTVAGLFAGTPAGELAALGEYGVQYLGSERALQVPELPEDWLSGQLGTGGLSGVLILDTRPILDFFTRSALRCADLVLVPVKDRASLVNAGALQKQLVASGQGAGSCWLVPSLIDGRLRLKEGVGMRDYLAFLGEERGLQVYDGFIAKSPKVEGLASGFSSRIPPVITHARGTQVHQQFRQLADFVLQQLDRLASTVTSRASAERLLLAAAPGARRRLLVECPVCGRPASGAAGELFLHLRSRRRGFLHPECLPQLLAGADLQALLQVPGMLALEIRGGGESGGPGRYRLHLFDGEGEPVLEEKLGARSLRKMREFVLRATGCGEEQLLRELVLISLLDAAPAGLLAGSGRSDLARLRRRVLRQFAAAR